MLKIAKDDVCIPDSYFLFYDNVIIFDLRNQKTYITALGIKEESEKSISKIYERIKDKYINLNISLDKNTEFTSNFSREDSNICFTPLLPVVFKIGPLIVESNSLSLSNPLILIILGLSNSFSTPFLSYLMYSMFNFLHTSIVFSLTFFA